MLKILFVALKRGDTLRSDTRAKPKKNVDRDGAGRGRANDKFGALR